MHKSWKALAVLLTGLIFTTISVLYAKNYIQKVARLDFEFVSNDLQGKMEARLRAHAQLLRSGAALFAVSDTVTREMWRSYYEESKVHKYLPGIQGLGYTEILPADHLERHIELMRENGFPDYDVFPEGERDIYTSIVYLEPFSDRNLRAFGFDMFAEATRRKAMETARDSSFAVLSGKVRLIQETETDVQAGALMFAPVYRRGMPLNTVEERRAAIKGWVYSPYRIADLTYGILGAWDLQERDRIRMMIYDSFELSYETLLYDSQWDEDPSHRTKPNLAITLPVRMNSEEWVLVFSRKSNELSFFNADLLIVMISGITISLLLFMLTSSLIRSNLHSRQIRVLNIKLEKLNADKDRFISILGHDLKNPFTCIFGYTEILINEFETMDKGSIRKYLGHVNTSAKNTYKLLEDILEWVRTQSYNYSFNPRHNTFGEICKDINAIIEPAANAKNISINYSSQEVRVYADKDMLKTILRNLCSNAVKFTGRGGEINIGAEEDNSRVNISVSDNGVGIRPEDLKKLFDISRQLTSKGTENESGSGLGLLLCKELVDQHGGQIRAESVVGRGSRFIVSLPFKRASYPVKNEEPKSEPFILKYLHKMLIFDLSVKH
jgi:signal transduction histidine kinase